MISSGIIRLLGFLIFFGYYREYCFFCGEGSFFYLFSVNFVSDVCLSIYYTCFLLCLLLVCWVRENFSGGLGHIFSACVTSLCGVPGRYNLFECFLGADGGTVQVFLFLWLCCSGYGTVEMMGGGLAFFSFLYFAVGSPGVRLPVVGFCSFIN